MNQRCTKVLLMALFAAFIGAPAFAQATATSAIQGVVQDTGGGVIPGATVTATNEATSGKSTVVSSANGTFTIPALGVGSYTVEVELCREGRAQGHPCEHRRTASLLVSSKSEASPSKSSSKARHRSSRRSPRPRPTPSRRVRSAAAARIARHSPVRHAAAGRQHPGRQPRLHGQRPAAGSINITVDGVSVQDNYLIDGRILRAGPGSTPSKK
jgi:hypothetical protein